MKFPHRKGFEKLTHTKRHRAINLSICMNFPVEIYINGQIYPVRCIIEALLCFVTLSLWNFLHSLA